MTRCAKFHHLSQYKAYREQVSKLVNLGIEEDFVFENFPEGPGRVLSNIKDDETRTKALNYVASCLKRGEKVTEGDLRGVVDGGRVMIKNKMRFYPKVEEFPDDILCPLCKNQKKCDQSGEKSCKSILAMCDDMQDEPRGFLQ